MCSPTGMMVGGLGLSGAQALLGFGQGQAQAAYAAAAAQSGYMGAMIEYQQQVDYLERTEDWKWSEYQRNVGYRQQLIEFEQSQWEDVIASASQNYEGQMADLQTGIAQLREATMASLQDMWLTFSRASGTRAVNAAVRGVEGKSIEDVQNEAHRAMYVKEETALTNLEWAADAADRQAKGFQASAQSTINQARPGPQPHVAMPGPAGYVNMPQWSSYALQGAAGAAQGMNTSINSIIGGASGALSSFGQYYAQTNPPAPSYTFNF